MVRRPIDVAAVDRAAVCGTRPATTRGAPTTASALGFQLCRLGVFAPSPLKVLLVRVLSLYCAIARQGTIITPHSLSFLFFS